MYPTIIYFLQLDLMKLIKMNWVIFREIVVDMVGNKDEQILLLNSVYFLLKTNDTHDTFESFKSCVKFLNTPNYNFNSLAQLRFEISR